MPELSKLTEGLTEQQKNAVLYPASGRLRIAAGAGSGKTEVLTRRIAALIESGIRPEELVAITYTQKAAAEMKTRLVARRQISPAGLRNMEVSTFHAFLSRFLKQDPFGAGLDRSISVVAENNRQLIMKELLEKFAEIYGEQIISGPEALGATNAMKLINEFPAALGKIRRYLLKPSEFYLYAREIFNRRGPDSLILEKNCLEWLYRFYTCYMEELERRGLLDFDEILIRGRNLIKEIREGGAVPERRIFLIDEFQDNNPDQLEVVNLFCRERESHITVVGDEKQSIYRFQGADVDTFRISAVILDIILQDNFRSYSRSSLLPTAFSKKRQLRKMFAPAKSASWLLAVKPPESCQLTRENETPHEHARISLK
jgi:DNA helicase-2/ATP-dependent DNA helicase PcrA